MAPPRPYWKGYIKLALVSCPIALYTASSSSERVAFRQINKKTGNRLTPAARRRGDARNRRDAPTRAAATNTPRTAIS